MYVKIQYNIWEPLAIRHIHVKIDETGTYLVLVGDGLATGEGMGDGAGLLRRPLDPTFRESTCKNDDDEAIGGVNDDWQAGRGGRFIIDVSQVSEILRAAMEQSEARNARSSSAPSAASWHSFRWQQLRISPTSPLYSSLLSSSWRTIQVGKITFEKWSTATKQMAGGEE